MFLLVLPRQFSVFVALRFVVAKPLGARDRKVAIGSQGEALERKIVGLARDAVRAAPAVRFFRRRDGDPGPAGISNRRALSLERDPRPLRFDAPAPSPARAARGGRGAAAPICVRRRRRVGRRVEGHPRCGSFSAYGDAGRISHVGGHDLLRPGRLGERRRRLSLRCA